MHAMVGHTPTPYKAQRVAHDRRSLCLVLAGAGALSAPLVATQFSQLPRWSFHYLVSLGLALINICAIASVYKFRTFEGVIPLIIY